MVKTWKVGQMCAYKGSLCIIDEICDSPLGFRLFKISNYDNGTVHTEVAKHELHEVVIQELTEADFKAEQLVPTPEEATVEELLATVEETTVTKPSRHADLSEVDLDEVAKKRLSAHTDYQTRWEYSKVRKTVMKM